MKTEKQKPFAHAMAFYHEDGLPAAWKQAQKFAGKGGRMATMPDIVAARLASKPGDAPWETWFTTTTAEYFGRDRGGHPVLVVAHGIGPMATLDGVLKAYSWQYKDKQRNRRGGRITQQEFWDLLDWKFGNVSVIDFRAYCKKRKYPFCEVLLSSQALEDPILRARLGPDAEKYILAHAEHARAWHREQEGLDPENRYKLPDYDQYLLRRRMTHRVQGADNSFPYIINLDAAANCSYGNAEFGYREIEEGYAIAHLVSTGRLVHMKHDGQESLALDIACHEWSDGVRLVGIQEGGGVLTDLHSGPNARRLLWTHWKELLVSTGLRPDAFLGFAVLMKVGDQWFTQYPKDGDCMDTAEPEFVVRSAEKVGEPILFRTTIGGYHGFFKYGMKEVVAIAPKGANGYCFVTDPQIESQGGNPTHHTAMVQFYRIEANLTERLIRQSALAHDFETMMRLLKQEAA